MGQILNGQGEFKEYAIPSTVASPERRSYPAALGGACISATEEDQSVQKGTRPHLDQEQPDRIPSPPHLPILSMYFYEHIPVKCSTTTWAEPF